MLAWRRVRGGSERAQTAPGPGAAAVLPRVRAAVRQPHGDGSRHAGHRGGAARAGQAAHRVAAGGGPARGGRAGAAGGVWPVRGRARRPVRPPGADALVRGRARRLRGATAGQRAAAGSRAVAALRGNGGDDGGRGTAAALHRRLGAAAGPQGPAHRRLGAALHVAERQLPARLGAGRGARGDARPVAGLRDRRRELRRLFRVADAAPVDATVRRGRSRGTARDRRRPNCTRAGRPG